MGRFLEKLMAAPEVKPLLRDEHFLVDVTLLQAWASDASLERTDGQKDPPPPPSGPGDGFGVPKKGKKRAKGDFRGVKPSNKTNTSNTDPDAEPQRFRGDPQARPQVLHRPDGHQSVTLYAILIRQKRVNSVNGVATIPDWEVLVKVARPSY